MTAAARIVGVMTTAAVLIACGGAGATELDRAATLAAACTGCHVKDGKAIVGLAGRSAEDIRASFITYKADAEGSSVMHRIARGYSEADIRLIAAHLAAREGR